MAGADAPEVIRTPSLSFARAALSVEPSHTQLISSVEFAKPYSCPMDACLLHWQ